MANDEEPVEKALMASSSVAVISKDIANSNLATLMALAESLPGELREPLSGGASTPLSGGASTPLSEGASTSLSGGASTPLSGGASTPLSGGASTPLSGGASTPLSGGASTPLSGGAPTPLSGGAPTPSGGNCVARNSATFAGPRAGYSKNGGRYMQQQGPSTQCCHAVCCRRADGRGYPLQGSTPQQK